MLPGAKPAKDPCHFVGGNAGRKVADCKYYLVGHQEQDHRPRRKSRSGCKFREVDRIYCPAHREKQLKAREIPAEAM